MATQLYSWINDLPKKPVSQGIPTVPEIGEDHLKPSIPEHGICFKTDTPLKQWSELKSPNPSIMPVPEEITPVKASPVVRKFKILF